MKEKTPSNLAGVLPPYVRCAGVLGGQHVYLGLHFAGKRPPVLAENTLFGILLLECKTRPSVLLNKERLINALGEAYNISVLSFSRWQRFFKFSCSFTLSKQTEFPNREAHKLCM